MHPQRHLSVHGGLAEERECADDGAEGPDRRVGDDGVEVPGACWRRGVGVCVCVRAGGVAFDLFG